MPVFGVADAAAALGVSPRRVRQMLADGVLSGERVGRTWAIGSEQLRQADRRRREVGRPWSPISAWAVLALADGEEPELSPVERSRAKKRLAKGLPSIVRRLGARATERWFYAHPGVLDRLGEAPQVVRTGISAAPNYGVDVVGDDGFEGYVRDGDLRELVARFGLDDQAVRPNVLLRLIDDAVWPFQGEQRWAGRAVVAIDLLESVEPRTRRAGSDLLERM